MALTDWTVARALSPFDLAVVTALTVAGGAYVAGVRSVRSDPQSREHRAFALGWAALMIAILPPMDSWSIQLFSVHMGQHELMMLIGAPLVMIGRPLPRWLFAMPARWRHRVGGILQRPLSRRMWAALTMPVVAWVLHGAAIWLWHVPAAYDLAVQNEAVHALQHLSFVGTSCLLWWGLLHGSYGRSGYGAAVLYVFTTAAHTGLLGALLTFAGVPLYDVYLQPAARHGIDPLADQQVAGLMMWIPAGVLFTALGLALFVAWLGEGERRGRADVAPAALEDRR